MSQAARNKSREAGQTLLEAVVYITILVLLLVFLVNILLSVTRVIAEVRISRSLGNSAVVALERMTREIRAAETIDLTESILDSHPGQLVLEAIDEDGNDIITKFYLTNGILQVETVNPPVSSLIAAELEMSNLIFRQIISPSSEAVKIEFTLRNREGKIIKSRNFYQTAVLRGSYE